MRKFFAAAALSASALGLSVSASFADYTLTILHINDWHSRIESNNKYESTCSTEEEGKGECIGGAARLVTAMILLLMFKIHPTPLDAETLSYEMKIDRRTADNRLNDLASEGFTLHMKGQGYVLTSQTRSLVAQLFGSILVAPLETQALTPRSTDQASAIPALALSSQDQALSLDAQEDRKSVV